MKGSSIRSVSVLAAAASLFGAVSATVDPVIIKVRSIRDSVLQSSQLTIPLTYPGFEILLQDQRHPILHQGCRLPGRSRRRWRIQRKRQYRYYTFSLHCTSEQRSNEPILIYRQSNTAIPSQTKPPARVMSHSSKPSAPMSFEPTPSTPLPITQHA